MLKILLISIITLIASGVIISDGMQKKNDDVHRFIFSLSSMNTASVDDALGICRVLVEQIKKKNKRVEKTEVLICRDIKEILEKSANGFDLIVLSPAEYLTLNKQRPLQPIFVSSTDGHQGLKYLLVVNKNDNIKTLEQLAGSDLRILGREQQQTQELIINQLLKKYKLPKKELFFRSINSNPLISNVVLPVFFKKAKAALVSEESLKLISEINPQLEKDLMIIYQSPIYLSSIACLNKRSDELELRKIFYDILENLHTEPFGRQLLDLFRIEKLVPYKEEYLNEYLKLYD